MTSLLSYKFRKPKRAVTRIFLHCSASDNPDHDNVATMDLWHRQRGWAGVGYHLFIRKSGLIEIGRDLEKVPAAQEGNNARTIAICLHGLAREKFTEAQFEALRGLCQQINAAYEGEVTFHGHCEVANKACPVFDYKTVLGLRSGGVLPLHYDQATQPIYTHVLDISSGLEEPPVQHYGALKIGVKGSAVRDLQKSLAALGYFAGALDGDFGERTRAAVLAFQADNDLIADGVFGPASREALKVAKPRAVSEKRAAASVVSLAKDGSRIAKASLGNGAVGLLFTGGGMLTVAEQASGVVSQLTGYAGVFQSALASLGPWLGVAVLAGGAVIVWQSIKAGTARVDDHRSGKTS